MTVRDTIVGLMRCPTGSPKPCQACYYVVDEILAAIEAALLSNAAVKAAQDKLWKQNDPYGWVPCSDNEHVRAALTGAIESVKHGGKDE
jgi:hypothetical protein